MSWDSVDTNKATEKQIKYAEKLLEALYGDINVPIYSMSKSEISNVIEEAKHQCQVKNIEYHEPSERIAGSAIESLTEPARRALQSVETAVRSGRNLYSDSHINTATTWRPEIHPEVRATIDDITRREIEIQRNQLLQQIRRETHREAVRDEYTGDLQVRMSWRDFRAMQIISRQTLLNERNPADMMIDINEGLVREIAERAIEEQRNIDRVRQSVDRMRMAYETLIINPLRTRLVPKVYNNTFFGDSVVEMILRGDE